MDFYQRFQKLIMTQLDAIKKFLLPLFSRRLAKSALSSVDSLAKIKEKLEAVGGDGRRERGWKR